MGLITKELLIWGSDGRSTLEALFESGASACFVREDVARELGPILKAPFPLSFTLGNEESVTAEQIAVLYLQLRGHNLWHTFFVVPRLPYSLIIGADFLQRWNIGLDPVGEELIVDEKALKIFLV